MDANEVVECYVTDVAVQLPRRLRNDVAFELRALIGEGLQDRAEAAGRPVDAPMAMEFLQAFGRPEDVAARYRPTLTLIDPADGHAFVRATVIGLLVIWGAGLLLLLQQPVEAGIGSLSAWGQWWTRTVVASLWWPGMLLAGFAGSSWLRMRFPQSAAWKPRPGDRIYGSRAATVLGIIGILCGVYVLIEPRWVIDVLFGGRAAPAAYHVLTYAETFQQRRAPVLYSLLLLNVPLLVAVIVKGRWTPTLRRLEFVLGLATCAAMVWCVLAGPIFIAPITDQFMKFGMLVLTALTVLQYGITMRRRVKPAPKLEGGIG